MGALEEGMFVPDSILLRKMGSFVNVTVVGRESVLHFENKNVSLLSWASYFMTVLCLPGLCS